MCRHRTQLMYAMETWERTALGYTTGYYRVSQCVHCGFVWNNVGGYSSVDLSGTIQVPQGSEHDDDKAVNLPGRSG